MKPLPVLNQIAKQQPEINTPQGAADRFFSLKTGLSDLLGHTIDLVDLTTIQNPYFLEAIAPSRLKIYGN